MSFSFSSKIESVQQNYDSKVAKLQAIEQSLILQEQKILDLQEKSKTKEANEATLGVHFANLQDEYETYRLETEQEMRSRQKTTPKRLCGRTGNVICKDDLE